MAQFFQQVVSGLASGAIYAALALALVLIHRATGVINFAQGEMAMFSTYIAWTLTANHGWSYWPAFAATIVLSFIGGLAVQRTVIRPIERAPILTIVIVTIGRSLRVVGSSARQPITRSMTSLPSPGAWPNHDVSLSGLRSHLRCS